MERFCMHGHGHMCIYKSVLQVRRPAKTMMPCLLPVLAVWAMLSPSPTYTLRCAHPAAHATPPTPWHLQDNLLWETLTAVEHLRFFGRLKNLEVRGPWQRGRWSAQLACLPEALGAVVPGNLLLRVLRAAVSCSLAPPREAAEGATFPRLRASAQPLPLTHS